MINDKWKEVEKKKEIQHRGMLSDINSQNKEENDRLQEVIRVKEIENQHLRDKLMQKELDLKNDYGLRETIVFEKDSLVAISTSTERQIDGLTQESLEINTQKPPSLISRPKVVVMRQNIPKSMHNMSLHMAHKKSMSQS